MCLEENVISKARENSRDQQVKMNIGATPENLHE